MFLIWGQVPNRCIRLIYYYYYYELFSTHQWVMIYVDKYWCCPDCYGLSNFISKDCRKFQLIQTLRQALSHIHTSRSCQTCRIASTSCSHFLAGCAPYYYLKCFIIIIILALYRSHNKKGIKTEGLPRINLVGDVITLLTVFKWSGGMTSGKCFWLI